MTSRDFVMWLRGYLDNCSYESPPLSDIINKLEEVELDSNKSNLILDSPPEPRNPILPYRPKEEDFPGSPAKIYMGDKQTDTLNEDE